MSGWKGSRLWGKLPRLTRGQQAVLYLLLLPLVAVLLWGRSDFPIFDPCLNLRRAEMQNLAGPSDIQGVVRNHSGSWAVGVYMDQVLLSPTPYGDRLCCWPRREEGPTLLPIPNSAFGVPAEAAEEIALAAVDLPQGTASARLEVELGCWYTEEWGRAPKIAARMEDLLSESEGAEDVQFLLWEKRYTVDGELLKDGGCLFPVRCEGPSRDPGTGAATVEGMALACAEDWEAYDPYRTVGPRKIHCRMEAVFLDEEGGELARAELCTPES